MERATTFRNALVSEGVRRSSPQPQAWDVAALDGTVCQGAPDS